VSRLASARKGKSTSGGYGLPGAVHVIASFPAVKAVDKYRNNPDVVFSVAHWNAAMTGRKKVSDFKIVNTV